MQLHLIDLARYTVGLIVGGVIGLAFGTLQNAALRRHEEQERTGKGRDGWSLMPGSGVRVAYLLVALALVQLICPLLFADHTQWLVSAGVVFGYGWLLFQQLRQKLATSRP